MAEWAAWEAQWVKHLEAWAAWSALSLSRYELKNMLMFCYSMEALMKQMQAGGGMGGAGGMDFSSMMGGAGGMGGGPEDDDDDEVRGASLMQDIC